MTTRRNSQLGFLLSSFITLSAGLVVGCAGEDSDSGQNESDIIVNANSNKKNGAKDGGDEASNEGGASVRDGGAEAGDFDASDNHNEGGAEGGGEICDPGGYVFCRCQDRREGVKLCTDGTNYGPCECD
jgi:hypothetical protein